MRNGSRQMIQIIRDALSYMDVMVAVQIKFKLRNANDEEYESDLSGTLGGNRSLKIYGRLTCRNALMWIEKGHYVKQRVFFIDEATAKAAGYRPCAICMLEEYLQWKEK